MKTQQSFSVGDLIIYRPRAEILETGFGLVIQITKDERYIIMWFEEGQSTYSYHKNWIMDNIRDNRLQNCFHLTS